MLLSRSVSVSVCLSLFTSVCLCPFLSLICSEVFILCGCFHRAFESELSSGISIRLHLLPELCANSNIPSSEKRGHKTFYFSDLKSHMIQSMWKELRKRKEEQIVRPSHSHKEILGPIFIKPAPAHASCPQCSFPNSCVLSFRRACRPGFKILALQLSTV